MSLGLHRAGFKIVGGVEANPQAARTHAINFFAHEGPEVLQLHSQPHDITTLSPEQFMRSVLRAEQPQGLVDVICGGPPCQAFARIGRAKLRDLMKDQQAHLKDSRAILYLHYLEYVAFFRPLVVLMENVPDIMNFGGQNVAEEIACLLEELGYKCRYTLLNSAHYGVPQTRHRLYLIALLDELNVEPSFPPPTNHVKLPSGYTHVHSVALRALRTSITDGGGQQSNHYVEPPSPVEGIPAAVSARQALSDLPPIDSHLQGIRNATSFEILAPYRPKVTPSAYGRLMREWPSFGSEVGVQDHVTRYLPRDFPIFSRMQPGDQYPHAHSLAMRMFRKALIEHEQRLGRKIEEGSVEYEKLKSGMVPPYRVDRFPNKWWKLEPDQPVRTLTAHIGKDTYSHIHYDSSQARVISVREAARLQSFPDGFKFIGPMNPAFTQIGNAVPPLQAYALASHVLKLLEHAQRIAPVVVPAESVVLQSRTI